MGEVGKFPTMDVIGKYQMKRKNNRTVEMKRKNGEKIEFRSNCHYIFIHFIYIVYFIYDMDYYWVIELF